ncbi:hypothetical protein M0802_004095 [Mischocyttarus mexicanus]|nr:hypothetical protein M0802_004095 [Mischocyttarus mexicanus]
MSKLYVGNLSSECNENALRQLFQDHNLSCTTILVKRGGYAFVDCADQSTADRAIDKLNGELYLHQYYRRQMVENSFLLLLMPISTISSNIVRFDYNAFANAVMLSLFQCIQRKVYKGQG